MFWLKIQPMNRLEISLKINNKTNSTKVFGKFERIVRIIHLSCYCLSRAIPKNSWYHLTRIKKKRTTLSRSFFPVSWVARIDPLISCLVWIDEEYLDEKPEHFSIKKKNTNIDTIMYQHWAHIKPPTVYIKYYVILEKSDGSEL